MGEKWKTTTVKPLAMIIELSLLDRDVKRKVHSKSKMIQTYLTV